LLVLPLAGIIIIRIENERIQFYNLRKLLSFGLFMILLTSTVFTPFSYSLVYWGYAFAEEPPQDLGPPNGTAADEFTKRVHVLLDGKTSIAPTNEQLNKEIKDLLINKTSIPPSFQNTTTVELTSDTSITPSQNNSTIKLTENVSIHEKVIANQTTGIYVIKLSEKLFIDDQTRLNGERTSYNYLNEQLIISDTISLRFNNVTLPISIPEPIDEDTNKLLTTGIISDSIIGIFTNGSEIILPNSTESWQFENGTSDVTLVGDAELNGLEGVNGTSLLLDGDHDFAQANATNSTTYIYDMAISAWVKPDYSQGSPEFTVVSKGNSFVLSINHLWKPQQVAKFSIFDGIKWTTVESNSTIPENSWTHLTARFNKTTIDN